MLTEVGARDRLAREREFWDHLYCERANLHQETFAERYIRKLAYSRRILHSTLDGLRQKKILSIGGGVDRLAIHLADLGNTVITVDISAVAATLTRELARKRGVADRVAVVVGNCEEICFSNRFDVILCKRALHHMAIRVVVPAACKVLRDGGLFLAEEPICFLDLIRWFHHTAPFHPDPVRTVDEKELTAEDITFVTAYFRKHTTQFFDMVTRESIVYFLSRLHLEGLLTCLGHVDYLLTNRYLRFLRSLSSYVIIEAYK
jgi:2-polyprenyl-3-methyl-5-hydroxy-6-metoxy-1,4-benzoquinol methylase